METFTWLLELELSGVDGGWSDCSADVSLMDGPIEIADGIRSTSLIDLLANPGSISWVFDNSPANSAHLAGYYTIGHANCRSGFAKNIRVRYSEYYNSTRYYQGVYWLQKPIPSAGVFGEATTQCRAVDWLDIAMNVPLPSLAVQTSQTGDQLLTTLLAAVTAKPISTDFDTGDSTFPSAFDVDDVGMDSVYAMLGKIARSEYGRIYLQPSTGGGGVLKFERRNARLGNVTSLGTISNEMEDAVVIDDAGETYDWFKVQVTPRRVDTSLVILAVLDYHIYLVPGDERIFTLNYVEQASGSRISGKNIQTPVVSTDYKFGSVDDGTSEDLNASLTVTMISKGANSSCIKVKNSGGVAGYLNLFHLHGYGIYSFNIYTAEVGTAGLRVQTLEMPYQGDPLTADVIASYMQSVASTNNRGACRVNIHANKSAALMTYAMTGLISTRWTIAETQTALGGDYFINGRKRTVNLGNRLDVEWLMVPAGGSSIWVLSMSALDVDTKLGI